MEIEALSPELLARLERRKCRMVQAVREEPGTEAVLLLTIKVRTDAQTGELVETYKIKTIQGDEVPTEGGRLSGPQMSFPAFALAGLQEAPGAEWEPAN